MPVSLSMPPPPPAVAHGVARDRAARQGNLGVVVEDAAAEVVAVDGDARSVGNGQIGDRHDLDAGIGGDVEHATLVAAADRQNVLVGAEDLQVFGDGERATG